MTSRPNAVALSPLEHPTHLAYSLCQAQLGRRQTEGNFMQDRPRYRVEQRAVVVDDLVAPPLHNSSFGFRKTIGQFQVW